MASDRPISADTKDIGGGVRLIVAEAHKPGAMLAIELSLPGAAMPMSFVGKVVWCAPSPQSGQFEAGIQFVRIDAKDQQAILRYVANGETRASGGVPRGVD